MSGESGKRTQVAARPVTPEPTTATRIVPQCQTTSCMFRTNREALRVLRYNGVFSLINGEASVIMGFRRSGVPRLVIPGHGYIEQDDL